MTTIDRLRDLEQAATPGPWVDGGGEGWDAATERVLFTCYDNLKWERGDSQMHAALIAESRNALPALLAVAEAAREALEHVRHHNSCRVWPSEEVPCDCGARSVRDTLVAALARLEATE